MPSRRPATRCTGSKPHSPADDIWQSMRLSLLVASVATLVALLLGTLAAFALARSNFRAKESITLLFVLPIALPGIITGLALLAGIRSVGLTPASGPSSPVTRRSAW